MALLLSVLRGLALGKNPVSGTLLLYYVVGCLYADPSRKKPRVGDAFAIAYVVGSMLRVIHASPWPSSRSRGFLKKKKAPSEARCVFFQKTPRVGGGCWSLKWEQHSAWIWKMTLMAQPVGPEPCASAQKMVHPERAWWPWLHFEICCGWRIFARKCEKSAKN